MSTCCNKCGEPHCICHIAFPSDFSLEHAVSKMRDSRTIAKLEAELSATQQKLEAAEAENAELTKLLAEAKSKRLSE